MTTSELRIRLDASPLYCRLSMAIYLIAACFVYQSSLHWMIKLCLAASIIRYIHRILVFRKPHPGLDSIHYVNEKWQLTGKKTEEFIDIKQLIDTVFFQLLLCVSETGKKKKLLLFQDQIEPIEQRQLQFILNSKKNQDSVHSLKKSAL